MKKKIILIIKIAVISLAVLSVIPNLCGRLILPANVLRVEFQGYYDICGSYWIEGDGLEEYAMGLVEKHDLATRP